MYIFDGPPSDFSQSGDRYRGAGPPLTAQAPHNARGAAGYPQAPSLQALVEKFGGYHNITPQAWAEHDESMRQWHIARRIYTVGCVIAEKLKPKRKRARATRRNRRPSPLTTPIKSRSIDNNRQVLVLE